MHQIKTVLRRVAACGIISVMCVTSAAATTGTVSASALRLRADASTSSSILTTAPKGSTVTVLGSALADGWYQVSYANMQGFMSSQYLIVAAASTDTTATAAAATAATTVAADTTTTAVADTTTYYAKVTTSGSVLNMRYGAGTEYSRVTTIPDGTILTLGTLVNGWYYVTYNGYSGYVLAGYLTLVDEATALAAMQAATVSTAGQQIAAYAQNFLGCPYVYGASGPSSFDCSGFTSYIYKQFGYSIAHGASSQLSYGTYVSMSGLQPGDLVFFRYNTSYAASHVGIYIGNGQFIHASTNDYVVRIDNLTYGHYANCFIGGRHVVS